MLVAAATASGIGGRFGVPTRERRLLVACGSAAGTRVRLQHAARGVALRDGDPARQPLARGVRAARHLLRDRDLPELGGLRARPRLPRAGGDAVVVLRAAAVRRARRARRSRGRSLPLRAPRGGRALRTLGAAAAAGDGHRRSRARARDAALSRDRRQRARGDRRALRAAVGDRGRAGAAGAAADRDAARGRIGHRGRRLHAHAVPGRDAGARVRRGSAGAGAGPRHRPRRLRARRHGLPAGRDDARAAHRRGDGLRDDARLRHGGAAPARLGRRQPRREAPHGQLGLHRGAAAQGGRRGGDGRARRARA